MTTQANNQHKKIFDHASLGMARVAPDGRWLEVNDKLCEIVGYSKRELLNITVQDITHPDDMANDVNDVNRLLSDEIQHYAMDKRYVHRNGHIIWIRLNVSLIRNEHNRPDYFISIIEDISELHQTRELLKKSEEKRIQSEEKYRLLVDQAPVIVYSFAEKLGGSFYSAQAAKVLGYSLDELYSKPMLWHDSIHPDDIAMVDATIMEAKTNQQFNIDYRIQAKNGEWIWLNDRHIKVDSNDGFTTIYGVATEITAKKHAEEILNNTQKELQKQVGLQTAELKAAKIRAEQANEFKSRFIANMSHELRTPMHAILSFASLGLKRSAEDKIVRYLENIHTSGIRLTSLLNNLLDLSKLEAGKMKIDFQQQDILESLHDARNEVSSLLAEKSISVQISPRQEMSCDFDKNLMMQVFINLFSNAIKFSPEYSVISVTLNMKSLQTHGHTLEIMEIAITDEGVGIPSEQLELIFNQFEQSTETRSHAGGTGLGLPIVREIIHLHHGRVWAESPPKNRLVGSTFILQLPKLQQ